MSIASQLTALEGNISNAYDMVAQRGGTVPARKNMENLDDAIATIPSGGGFTPTTPTITSATYDSATSTITITGTDFGSSPKVQVYNRAYHRYDDITPTTSSSTSAVIPVGNVNYGYYSRVVRVVNGGFESQVKFVYADYENLGSASAPEIVVWYRTSNSTLFPLTAAGGVANDFAGGISALNSNYSQNLPGRAFSVTKMSDSSSVSVPSHAIYGAEFSVYVTDLTHSGGVNLSTLLSNCAVLNQPMGFANLEVITTPYMSGRFMAGCFSFNSPIDTSHLQYFPAGFLFASPSFNQPLDFSSAKYIGQYFLGGCSNFDQEINISGNSSNTVQIDQYFMLLCPSCTKEPKFNYCDLNSTYLFYDSINIPAITFTNSTVSGTSQYAFGGYNSGSTGFPSTQYGTIINGDSTAQTIYNNFSGSTSYGRHLVLGTITP